MHAPVLLSFLVFTASIAAASLLEDSPSRWREQKRIIDLHQHISSSPQHLARAVEIADRVGVGLAINLSGGTVTPKNSGPSDFERNIKLAQELHPCRFLLYMNLDYKEWDSPDFSSNAVKQIEEGHRLGAAGLKEYKRLGLYLRDKHKNLIRVDDPKLDPVWRRCGQLGLPVSIHVADPKAFWDPYEPTNERWIELKDHRSWWFGDPALYPPRDELLAALNRVIERHPATTFVCVHFANNAEDLDWVEQSLDKYPNMMADLAARIPEIGRHPPEKVRRLFVKHQDRILFATDFQVYDRLTLGSGGGGPGPTQADALAFFGKHWRWLESQDRNFQHMTPIQGEWPISGIGLPPQILRKIYFENASRLLTPFLPPPRLLVTKVTDPILERDLFDHDLWDTATASVMDRESRKGEPRPAAATLVRVLYSSEFLYVRFDGRYREFTTFEPARFNTERAGLWDRDVVEMFIAPEADNPKVYYEFEVAPTGEKLDLHIDPQVTDLTQRLAWNSGFAASVQVNSSEKIWSTVMKIPLTKLSSTKPAPGSIWRVNFYRIDRAQSAFLAWNPTLTTTFHKPERFGFLEFSN